VRGTCFFNTPSHGTDVAKQILRFARDDLAAA